MAAYILLTIKNLDKEVAFLKALVQQVISKGENIGQDNIIVDADYIRENKDEILVDGITVGDTKPAL